MVELNLIEEVLSFRVKLSHFSIGLALISDEHSVNFKYFSRL